MPSAAFEISMNLRDFGGSVTVQPPPATEVVTIEDHPELLDQLLQMGQPQETA